MKATPRVVKPSLKPTRPVSVPAPGLSGVTVAVNVTAWPKVEGLAEELSVIVVLTGLTVCVSAVVLALNLVSPL